jgi:hypothetical protein
MLLTLLHLLIAVATSLLDTLIPLVLFALIISRALRGAWRIAGLAGCAATLVGPVMTFRNLEWPPSSDTPTMLDYLWLIIPSAGGLTIAITVFVAFRRIERRLAAQT